MENQAFTTTLTVSQSPKVAFAAINNVRGWWSEMLEGNSAQLHDEFSYRHKEFHYSRQRLIEFVPDQKVVWLVTDSKLTFVQDQTEWTNTKIVFEVVEANGMTEIRFTHEGLVPAIACYKDCSGGWNHYLKGSLLPLITTGVGKPDRPGE